MPDTTAYDELYLYTLELAQQERDERPRFILQHVVDARAAQNATAATKPMTVVFALMGLYLHLEKGFTGREVQLAHMKLGKKKHQWPAIALPEAREDGLRAPEGSKVSSAADVMRFPAGAERDAAIDEWCQAVWKAYAGARETIVALMKEFGIGTSG